MNTEKNDFRTCLFSSTEKKASYRLKWGAFRRVFSFSSSIPKENHRKSFYCHEKYFAKENFYAPAWTSTKCYCGNKTGNPERAVSSARVANHSAGFGSPCPLKDCNKSRSIRYSRIWVTIYQSFYGLLKFSVDLSVLPWFFPRIIFLKIFEKRVLWMKLFIVLLFSTCAKIIFQ